MRLVSILILLLALIPPVPIWGLSEKYEATLRQNLWLIIDKKPRYVWGGAESEEKGLDCSGYLYLAAKRSGLPVKRVTAVMMEAGLGNWSGKKVTLDDAQELDIVWWTWLNTPHRKHGHLGFFLINKRASNLLEVTHSSTSKNGVVIQQLRGQLLRDISSIKRLTIGDKNEGSNQR